MILTRQDVISKIRDVTFHNVQSSVTGIVMVIAHGSCALSWVSALSNVDRLGRRKLTETSELLG